MSEDEREIRGLVAAWMAATKAGDVDTVMALMTEDALFLVPGGVMDRSEFEAASRSAGHMGATIDGTSEIEELEVAGEWAFMRSRIHVVMTPPGGPPVERAGHTLTVLRKRGGRWRLARDANLLAPLAR